MRKMQRYGLRGRQVLLVRNKTRHLRQRAQPRFATNRFYSREKNRAQSDRQTVRDGAEI